MPTSLNTTKQVLDVILRYVPKEQLPQLINDLLDVSGNSSFHESIVRLRTQLSIRQTRARFDGALKNLADR